MRSSFVYHSTLCYATQVTKPHKKIIYITWKELWGPFVPKRK